MNNKMFFEETTPGVFERNRKFGLKNIGGHQPNTNKLMNFVTKFVMGLLISLIQKTF